MNPLWKVFSDFDKHHPPPTPPPPFLVWSGADNTLRPQTGLNEEDPEACGESPRHHFCPTESQPFPVPPQASGGSYPWHPASCSMNGALPWVGSPTAAPDTEQISACRHASTPERGTSNQRRGGGSKRLSGLTLQHFRRLCCCVPTRWHPVIKHPRGGALIFQTPPPTDGLLIINWSSAIFLFWSRRRNSGFILLHWVMCCSLMIARLFMSVERNLSFSPKMTHCSVSSCSQHTPSDTKPALTALNQLTN